MANLKGNLLSVGIAILLTIFFSYGAFVVNPTPENDCYDEYLARPLVGETQVVNETLIEEQRQCQDQWNVAWENVQLKNAIALTVLGTIAIITGALLVNRAEYVGNGILGGGILTVIYATLANWNSLSPYVRLFLIALALGLLIYFGYKKIERH